MKQNNKQNLLHKKQYNIFKNWKIEFEKENLTLKNALKAKTLYY